MNARLYDPVLGRMISPDNFVNGAFASQAYNRYSYANNNPLKYIDPDGNHPVVVAIAIAAVLNIAQQVMYNEGFNNFNVESLVLSMIQGAISAGIAGGIGDLIKPLTGFTKLAAGIGLHGLSGGLQAAVFGGNIGQGVLSGMIGHGVGELFVGAGVSQNMGLLGNFVVGGMSSALVATAMGNDPMQAFIIGGATAAFNSFMHQGGDEDGMTQYERNQQNPTLAIDAFWGIFGTVADVVEVGYKGLASAGRWLAGKYAARQTVKQVAKVGCFVEGTPVWTEKGMVAIEKVKQGDIVYGYDIQSGSVVKKPVSTNYQRTVKGLVKIETIGETIYTTIEHPFFVSGKWQEAGHLKAGDSLFLHDKSSLCLQRITLIDTLVNVYNFTVEDVHDYFVTTSKILVHNNDPCSQGVTIIKQTKSKVDYLLKNRSDAMNWAREQLGHNTEKMYNESGKLIGWRNSEGSSVYWGHGDWGTGVGSSKFPHLNYSNIGGRKGHLFLQDKITNRGMWGDFTKYFGL